MGFTPINSEYGAPLSPRKRLQLEAPPVELSTPANDIMTAVSKHLGRGESSKPTLVADTTKSATRGKKRGASRSNRIMNSKVCRRNNVGDNLHVIDQADQQAPAGSAFTADPQGRSSNKVVSSNCQLNTRQAVGIDSHDADHQLSVPLFSSFTTMDALESTSSRTSMDIISASGGGACTIYECTSILLRRFSRDDAQSWLPVSESFANSCKHHLDAVSNGSSPQRIDSGPGDQSAMPEPVKHATRKAKQIATEKTSGLDNSYGGQDHIAPVYLERLQPPPAAVQHEQGDLRSSKPGPGNASSQNRHSSISEDDFSEDIDDDILANAALAVGRHRERPQKMSPTRSSRQNSRVVDELEDYGGLLLFESDRETLSKYSSSAVSKNRPIVRASFPSGILDRSPVFGASSAVILRTCFRLGEALNAGSQAVRNNRSVVLEIYARVASSWRERQPGRKQYFQLKDLYHDKPPYLEGVLELHDQSDLCNLDSKAFLDCKAAKPACRAVARMKRTDQKWCLEILSIWEATLEDVKYAAGIYEAGD